MSTVIMAQCWPLQMPPTPKAVLISLADNANDHGHCWPSLTTIAERTCFGRTAVIEAIKWLEANGALKADRSDRYRTTYMVTPGSYTAPALVRQVNQSATRTSSDGGALVREADNEVRQPDDEVREADTNRQEPPITVTKSNRQTRRAKAPPADALRFEEFWTAYPVKAGKQQCLAKWKARNLDAIADQILADIAVKADKDRRWLGGYVPNPQTYINQDRWSDPVQPVLVDGATSGHQPSRNRQTDIEQKNQQVAADWARGSAQEDVHAAR